MKFYGKIYFLGSKSVGLFDTYDCIEFTFSANNFEDAIKTYSSYDKSFSIKIDGGYKVINTSSVKYIDILEESAYLKQQEEAYKTFGKKKESSDNNGKQEVVSQASDTVTTDAVTETLDSIEKMVRKRKYNKKSDNVENEVTTNIDEVEQSVDSVKAVIDSDII